MKTILQYLFLAIGGLTLIAGPIWAGFHTWDTTDVDSFWGFVKFIMKWSLWTSLTESVGAAMLGIASLFDGN